MIREYTDAEVAAMKTAFERVENPKNWKMPIDKTLALTLDEIRTTIDAIIFYAGCVPTIDNTRKPGVYRVRAVGYYNAIGA